VIPSIVDNDSFDENIRHGRPFSAPTASCWPAAGRDQAALPADVRPCEGQCSQGLPVADVLRFLMYAENFGSRPGARALQSPAAGVTESVGVVPYLYRGVPQRVTLAPPAKAQQLFA